VNGVEKKFTINYMHLKKLLIQHVLYHDIKDIKKIFRGIIMNTEIKLKFKKIYEDSQLPTQGYEDDVGLDLYVHHIEDCDNYIKIYTGIAVEPEKGIYILLLPRSSTCKKGLMLYNNCGVIDNGYRNEILGILYKTNDFKKLPKKGDRLLQLIPQHQSLIKFEEVDELSDTNRGVGGFGSTGE